MNTKTINTIPIETVAVGDTLYLPFEITGRVAQCEVLEVFHTTQKVKVEFFSGQDRFTKYYTIDQFCRTKEQAEKVLDDHKKEFRASVLNAT